MRYIIYFLLSLTLYGCTKDRPRSYTRIWKQESELIGGNKILTDTVLSCFSSIDNFTHSDSSFFKSSSSKPIGVWIKSTENFRYFKIQWKKNIDRNQKSVKLVKCIASSDSSREDHVLSFLILEDVGIISESNSAAKSYWNLVRLINNQNGEILIDSLETNSIYLLNKLSEY